MRYACAGGSDGGVLAFCFENGLDRHTERGEILMDRAPQHFVVNTEVLVDNNIAHADHLMPRQFRITRQQ